MWRRSAGGLRPHSSTGSTPVCRGALMDDSLSLLPHSFSPVNSSSVIPHTFLVVWGRWAVWSESSVYWITQLKTPMRPNPVKSSSLIHKPTGNQVFFFILFFLLILITMYEIWTLTPRPCRHLHICGVVRSQCGGRRSLHRHGEHHKRNQQSGEGSPASAGASGAHHAKVGSISNLKNVLNNTSWMLFSFKSRFVSVRNLLVPNDDGKKSQVRTFSEEKKNKPGQLCSLHPHPVSPPDICVPLIWRHKPLWGRVWGH